MFNADQTWGVIAGVLGLAIVAMLVVQVVVALLQISRSQMPSTTKAIWVLVVIVAPLLAPFAWFLIGQNFTGPVTGRR